MSVPLSRVKIRTESSARDVRLRVGHFLPFLRFRRPLIATRSSRTGRKGHPQRWDSPPRHATNVARVDVSRHRTAARAQRGVLPALAVFLVASCSGSGGLLLDPGIALSAPRPIRDGVALVAGRGTAAYSSAPGYWAVTLRPDRFRSQEWCLQLIVPSSPDEAEPRPDGKAATRCGSLMDLRRTPVHVSAEEVGGVRYLVGMSVAEITSVRVVARDGASAMLKTIAVEGVSARFFGAAIQGSSDIVRVVGTDGADAPVASASPAINGYPPPGVLPSTG